MSVNPYDLRAGLLTQAEGILSQKYHAEYDKIRWLVDKDILNLKTVTWPEPPSAEDIIEEATKLYKFVQTK